MSESEVAGRNARWWPRGGRWVALGCMMWALAPARLLADPVPPTAGPDTEAALPEEVPAPEVAPVGAPVSPRLRGYAIPNLAFDTDDGLGVGARGELALVEPGFEPYRQAYMLHLFLTTRGFHHHRFRFDRTRFGPGGRLRFTLHLAFRAWLNDGYWGIGNGTAREAEQAQEPDRYRYSLIQPFAHATLRVRMTGAWSLFGSVNGKWSRIESRPGSRLAEEQPFGLAGGPCVTWGAGLLRDTRAPEHSATQGMLGEVSGRLSLPLTGPGGPFGGATVSLRAFAEVGPGVVLAGRAMAEWLVGQVPFHELVHWGGYWPTAGFGGADTLRGVPFGRWRGPGKVLLNGEVRLDVLRHLLWGESLRWQLVPFVDLGGVWGAATQPPDREPDFPLHPGLGGGIRVIYQEVFVGRIDAAVGLDPVRDADGALRQEAVLGFYVVFDQLF